MTVQENEVNQLTEEEDMHTCDKLWPSSLYIRAVHLICNRVSLELSFWNIPFLVWSTTVRILLSSLCHNKFNIYIYIFFGICRLSSMLTVRLSSVPGDMVSADRSSWRRYDYCLPLIHTGKEKKSWLKTPDVKRINPPTIRLMLQMHAESR